MKLIVKLPERYGGAFNDTVNHRRQVQFDEPGEQSPCLLFILSIL